MSEIQVHKNVSHTEKAQSKLKLDNLIIIILAVVCLVYIDYICEVSIQ